MKNLFNIFSRQSASHFSFDQALLFWYRHYRKFFLLLFLLVISTGAFNYYRYVFAYHFTEDEKKQYIESYFKETLFQEKNFLSLVESLESRKQDYGNNPSLQQNIFLDR